MMPGIKEWIGNEDVFENLPKSDQLARIKRYLAQEPKPVVTLIEGAHR